jgi:hypothetical protein
VDQASADMETEAQKPQNQKNYENCPKHIESPVLIPEHLVEYMMTAGALRVCARLLVWARRSQKPACSILTSIQNFQRQK